MILIYFRQKRLLYRSVSDCSGSLNSLYRKQSEKYLAIIKCDRGLKNKGTLKSCILNIPKLRVLLIYIYTVQSNKLHLKQMQLCKPLLSRLRPRSAGL